jgi:tetratricopeptide (TPR) repeat protein
MILTVILLARWEWSSDFSAAVSLNPRLPLLHSQLGNAYFYSGDREQAKSEFTQELKINPRDFNANYRLGRLLREDRNLVDAAARLQTALQLRPDEIIRAFSTPALPSPKKASRDWPVSTAERPPVGPSRLRSFLRLHDGICRRRYHSCLHFSFCGTHQTPE